MTTNHRLLFVLASLGAVVFGLFLFPEAVWAQPISPSITVNATASKELSNAEVYTGLKLTLLITSMTFLPAFFMTATCFTRIAIVLATTRQALGTMQTPPNMVLLGLSVFLTFVVMGPVFDSIYTQAVVPYTEDQIGHKEALQKAFEPLKTFMLRNTREQDLALFAEITKTTAESPEKLGPLVVIPSFVISELNSAFQITFLIYLPFLVVDMIISSVLTSMSMITLPPTVVSLPIKLMLFVLVDGWNLIIGNLVKSYHM